MGQSNWEADKMLDVYIHDYLLKRNLQATAKSFMTEAKFSIEPIAIDAPKGFLFEWWSVFWDIFIARTNEKHSESAAAYIEAQQMKVKEQQQRQQLHIQQFIQQRNPQLQRRDINHVAINSGINSLNSDGSLMPSAPSLLSGKLYEDRLKNSIPLDSGVSPRLPDSRMGLLKSTTHHPGKLLQGNPGNVAMALQGHPQQTSDIRGDLGASNRSLPVDPSLYGQGMLRAEPGMGGVVEDVHNSTLRGWPVSDFEQLSSNLGTQVNRPSVTTNQFPLSSPQQHTLSVLQAQGNTANPASYGDMDPQRLRALGRGTLIGKDGKSIGNDGSLGCSIQSGSPRVGRQDQDFMMQQSSTLQSQDPLQQQQQQRLQPANKKRKQTTAFEPANSTGTGNNIGPISSPPLTPSAQISGDGVAVAGSFSRASSISKNMVMYGTDGVCGLLSSSNHLDDLEHLGDAPSLEEQVESFLSQDEDATDLFATLKGNLAEHNMGSSKGFTISEVGCIQTGDSKVVCCHFSSNGKFLASAGHEKRVFVWDMETFDSWSSKEEHASIISDICFRPETTQFATSSFDTTVRLWDAAAPTFIVNTYTGHNSRVTSLDFHPFKKDLFSSCDVNGEIRFWSASLPYQCSRVSKGANSQVRFQPRVGQFLAATSDNLVSILDIETERKITTIPGHNHELHYVCWHANGDYLAVVSHDILKVWSMASGKYVHELRSNGNKFRSCVFHPSYTNFLVIGGYQTLQLWDMVENRTMTVQAHNDLIAGLARSSQGMIASVSHDNSVKIWK